MAFIEETVQGNLVYMRSSIIPTPHAFSTRFGGVSTGELSSMNFGVSRGDKRENVKENYRRFCALFGVNEDGTCVTRQVHGNNVLIVTVKDRHKCLEDVPYEADGLVTGEKGMPVCCFTADCIPVLLADSKGHAVGAVHCGWRSSAADILREAVERMTELGAMPENICCALGPAIGSCCFETDEDVPLAIAKYLNGDTDGVWTMTENGKYFVNLREANRKRLLQLGLRPENIDVSDECTVCSHEKYWSHRYTMKHSLMRGNLGAMIMLE